MEEKSIVSSKEPKSGTPGEVLRRLFMDPLALTAYRMASDLGVPPIAISEILRGNEGHKRHNGVAAGRLFRGRSAILAFAPKRTRHAHRDGRQRRPAWARRVPGVGALRPAAGSAFCIARDALGIRPRVGGAAHADTKQSERGGHVQ